MRKVPVCFTLVAGLLAQGCGPTLGTIAVEPGVESTIGPGVRPALDGVSPVSSGSAGRSAEGPNVVCDRVLEDFEASPPGQFPDRWHTRAEDQKARAIRGGSYRVERDQDRSVLHATYRDEPITIGLPVEGWDLDAYPILQWSWRAIELPERADERSPNTNDSAASVYVVWEVGLPFMIRGIRYAWSTTQPAGMTISRRLGYDKVVIVRSGLADDPGWHTTRVNVKEHYASLFDRDDRAPPSGIAILTDADSTGSRAEAYYADFRLCRLEDASE